MLIIIPLIGFIFGIFVASFFSSLYLALALLLFALLSFVYEVGREYDHRFLFSLFLLFLSFGFLRVYVSALERPSALSAYVGTETVFSGVVVEAEQKEKYERLIVSLDSVSGKKVDEKILVAAPLYPKHTYGDRISFRAILEAPKDFESNERTFNYAGYLRAKGIYYSTFIRGSTLISSGNGFFLQRSLFALRDRFLFSIDSILEKPESSLLSGILLGEKQSLGEKLSAAFRVSGLSHIIVLSGYNIAVVGKTIITLMPAQLSKTLSVSFGALGILLFMILSGGGASVFRSGLMIMVSLWATSFGREYSAGKALLLVVTCMLLYNPLLLVFDPSFILSALATLGLILFNTPISERLSFVPEKMLLRETISNTLSAQVLVLPYILYSMGGLSPYSLLSNVLVLPTLPLVMTLGFGAALLGVFSVYLSFIPSLLVRGLLSYIVFVVETIQKLPGSSFVVPPFSFVFLVCIYGAIFLLYWSLVRTSASSVK